MAQDEAREGEEGEASVSDECPGVDKCHGCLKWCSMCGDVAHVCDMRLRGERCDEHPVPPTWQVLAIARREALRHIEEGDRMVREGGSMLSRVVDDEKARRELDKQEAEFERKVMRA